MLSLFDPWVHFSFIASIIAAIIAQMNHHLQMRGASLVLVRSVFGLILLAPFIAGMPWPTHKEFYIYFGLAALCAFCGDLILFEAARKFGGRLTSMFMPVKMFVAFGLWLVVDRVYLQTLFGDPLLSSAILLCLCFSAVGILIMRGCDTSWPAFKQVFFVGIFFALLDVFIKLGMKGTDYTQTSALFTFVSYVVHLPLSWGILYFRREKHFRVVPIWPEAIAGKAMMLLMAGVVIGGLSVLNSYTINLAIGLSPNPGYVGVLMLLSIVWLSLFNRIRGFDDRASWLSVFLLTLSAAGLILLTVG